jgi:hypothetical protein
MRSSPQPQRCGETRQASLLARAVGKEKKGHIDSKLLSE